MDNRKTRLLQYVNEIPPCGEIADPIEWTHRNSGLSTAYTNLLMTSIENYTSCKFLYGGMFTCYLWDLGRPYKRYRRLSTSQRKSMQLLFVNDLVCSLNVKLDALRLLDENQIKTWGIVINLMDPLTQVRSSAYDHTKASNHSIILIVQRESWYLFESTGKYRMVIGVICKACTIATGTRQNPYFSGIVTQDTSENTCVLWCAWAAFCVCVGYDKDSIMRLSNSSGLLRMHELIVFTDTTRMWIVDVLVVLHRLSVRCAQHTITAMV
jgi:hypothetical protein